MLERAIRDMLGTQKLMTMHGEDSAVDASVTMTENNIGAILVGEGTETFGIVTDHDIVARVVAQGLSPADTLLIHIMTPEPFAIGIDDTALEALFIMRDNNTRHLLVKDGDEIVGIISARDLMRVLVGQVLNESGVGDEMLHTLHA